MSTQIIFVNALVIIDSCNTKNGTIEIAKIQNKNFNNLLLDTNQDGSPELLRSFEKKLKFEKINLEPGDVFSFLINVHTDLRKIIQINLE